MKEVVLMKDDEWIVKQMKKKNEKAIYEIINKYGGLLKSIIKRHSYGYSSYHEECFNDVLLGAWNNIEQFDPNRGTLKNWLGAIARYQSLNIVRKYKKDMENLEYNDEKIIDLRSNTADVLAMREELDDFLSCLSDMDRDIFLKLYYEGFTVKELADTYNISTDNIYKRVSRARAKVRDEKGEVR